MIHKAQPCCVFWPPTPGISAIPCMHTGYVRRIHATHVIVSKVDGLDVAQGHKTVNLRTLGDVTARANPKKIF